ncbi:hypothetical protein HYV91_03325 [Candidatus Wolfebacteria bacterium]|nr:hypothetical protein [Candidatus Wolfebacteria bacterium]
MNKRLVIVFVLTVAIIVTGLLLFLNTKEKDASSNKAGSQSLTKEKGFTYKQALELCNQNTATQRDKNHCFREIATGILNVALCDQIIGIEKGDIDTLLKPASTQEERDECRTAVNKRIELAACESMENDTSRDICYYNFSIKRNDSFFCSKIVKQTDKQKCIRVLSQ